VLNVADMIGDVLGSEGVRVALRDEVENGLHGSRSEEQAEARAKAIAQRMFAGDSTEVFLGFAIFLRKLWRRLYDVIRVDTTHMERIRELSKKGSVVLLPTHRSYMDFLVVSFVCFCCKLPLPFIASGEDFLGILFVRYIFRQSRAFFLRRSFLGGTVLSP
jgi:glycerol-3-phosphate O-acyltransferase